MGERRFVGRRDALARLDEAVQTAGAGVPQVVVIGADAGIGKSTLMAHFADRLGEGDARILRTAAIELGTQGLPLAPVTMALRQLHPLPEAFRDLDQLLPEYADGQGLDRARMFELFGALLGHLGGERLLVWLIDDLHWADPSTRELLGYLARTLQASRVLIVPAYRADGLDRNHPLRPFLAELHRLPEVAKIDLPPFTRAETAELVRATIGPRATDELIDRVHLRSGGNAFMAAELALTPAGGLPDSLRDLMSARIDQLDETTRYVVQRAAVGGRSISHPLLAAISGLPAAELFQALRQAADQRVLLPEGAGYAFRHGLVREAVLDELLPAERTALHRVCAEALEADPALAEPERYAAELAYHWYESGNAAKALPALIKAADEAGRIPAYAEKAQQLGRALSLWDKVTPAGLDRLALYEQAIEAAGWAADPLQSLDLIDRAVDHTADPERLAMLFGHRGLALHSLDRDGALVAAEEALALLPEAPTLGRARVLDLLASVFTLRGRTTVAIETATEAAEIAAQLGDRPLEAAARTTCGWALTMLGSYDEGLAALEVARLRADGDQRQLARVDLNLATAYEAAGRYDDAVTAARIGLASARASGLLRGFGGVLAACLATALTALGRWDEALAAAADGLALDPPGMSAAALHTVRAEIAFGRGDFAAAREELTLARSVGGGASDLSPGSLMAVRQQAELALAEGRPDEARATVAGALGIALERGTPPHAWALVATGARIQRLAGVQQEALEETAKALRADSPALAAYQLLFAAELSGSNWPAVAAAWASIGHQQRTADAEVLAAAEALATGDRTAAADWLRSAMTRCDQLGAEPLRGQAEALARGGHLSLPTTEPQQERTAGLTERETEVLRLVAAGRSNKQIADELFVSAKTVSVHVSNILAKFGVASRGEAAATAHRLHLFD
ncbi:LuxR C-terminal-related transcriptional regulator [Kribbella sp. NBC_01245]|uniref:helix-turn-helix transcriptional regulator n=1 Tax=Kribbella sp. NBC_01245 TaxID=2903578 RepID=UPI002E2D6941|nr:AAA family ATPase [Kribbella sp. NBC_01245]